jgi:ribonuclease P protein component
MVARQYRLREEADVRRVQSKGKSWAHGPLIARVLPNDLDPAQNRYTVIAGKRCGKAVQRNRLKRLVREALRGFHPHLKAGYDIAVICRGDVEEMPTLVEAQAALTRIFTRASLLLPTAETAGIAPPQPGDRVTAPWKRRTGQRSGQRAAARQGDAVSTDPAADTQ